VDADGFWQVHPRAAAVLDDAVRTLLAGRVDPGSIHFDLYGGVGLLASSLAAVGATDIVTVESSRRATTHAQENLADVDATAVTARVDRYLAGLPAEARAGAVVLDPPRAGAGRAVVEGVHALHPDAVAYVACDPVALARDLGTFRGLGWNVAALDAFDLFPHSHHFETVALLTR
jgi:tRNA/tmRNA/rRNA uracil-C5-methylase (TrmA/RlmC/RlmD family)